MGFLPRPRNGISLCAGAGGLDMGLMLAEPGFHTRCFVEWEEYPRGAIIAAQRAGYFAPAPIWDDLTTFDARPLAGAIDTLIAGYPCQPFSMAGKRLGEDDPRHLWPHVARVARELGPTLEWLFLENVAGHVTLGAETVLRELWDMGFTPAAGIFSAGETGAAHERQRWFCVAYREGRGLGIVGDAAQPGRGRHADGGDFDLADAMRSGAGTGAEPHAQPATVAAGRGQRAESGDDHSAVADPGHTQRGAHLANGHHANGKDTGRTQGDSGARKRSWLVADPHGRHPGPERQQHGGQQRFQPEGGSNGGRSVDDAAHGGRGIHAGPGPEWRGTSDAGRARGALADCIRIHGDGRGIGGACWWPEFADRRRQMANASQPGPQGRERPGTPDQRDRPPAPRSTSERRGLPLFPPGPGDRDAWAAVMASNPDRAPSFARRDVIAAAVNIASILQPDEAQAVESALRGLARGAGMAAVGSQAPALVDQAQAFTRLCNLADGLANRSRSLRLLGNGVFPLAAAYAWRTLAASHGLRPVDMATADRDAADDATRPIWGAMT